MYYMAEANCNECGAGVTVAVWDDGVLSGCVVPVCLECSEDVPEDTLWNLSEIQEEPVMDLPSRDEVPIEDCEDFVVVNRTQENPDYSRDVSEEVREMEMEFDDHYDLFVRDLENSKIVEEGRNVVKEQKNE
jgi:hypothetical protein